MPEHSNELPPHVRPYRRTPEFTQDTVPAGLLRDHVTRAGTWALIHVLEGQLLYSVPCANLELVLSAETAPGVVCPQVPHSVRPLGAVRFCVEFHALDAASAASDPQRPSSGLPES